MFNINYVLASINPLHSFTLIKMYTHIQVYTYTNTHKVQINTYTSFLRMEFAHSASEMAATSRAQFLDFRKLIPTTETFFHRFKQPPMLKPI